MIATKAIREKHSSLQLRLIEVNRNLTNVKIEHAKDWDGVKLERIWNYEEEIAIINERLEILKLPVNISRADYEKLKTVVNAEIKSHTASIEMYGAQLDILAEKNDDKSCIEYSKVDNQRQHSMLALLIAKAKYDTYLLILRENP